MNTEPVLLQNGGIASLWAGWAATLPASYHQRNVDGSWSAWGADWAVDVTIIETSGNATGSPATAKELLDAKTEICIAGPGWIGTTSTFSEPDGDRRVFRLAARLAAVTTLICQRPFRFRG
jgi:hypothetical protein